MRDAYVHEGSLTRFGRRERGLAELAVEAVEGLPRGVGDVDHVLVAVQNPEELAGDGNVSTRVVTELGLVPTPATRIESGPSSGGSAFEAAVRFVQSGAVESVLVVAAERMTARSTPEVSRVLARMMDPRERAVGLTMPALAALTTRRVMHETGLSREVLAEAPVKAHGLAVRNPLAHFQREVTVGDVVGAPASPDPLPLYDGAPLSVGGAALLVARARGPVRVAGVGHATDRYALTDRRGSGVLGGFPATGEAARRAFAAGGPAPEDVDVAEVHDAFSILEITNLVDLGLASFDESVRMLQAGETLPDGALPVNPSGGLKARGHPTGATGLAQVVELLWQLTGEARGVQVAGDPRVGLAHNIGGYGNNVVVSLLEAVA